MYKYINRGSKVVCMIWFTEYIMLCSRDESGMFYGVDKAAARSPQLGVCIREKTLILILILYSIPKSPANTRPAAPYMFKCQEVICGTQVTCAHRSPGGKMSRVISAHRSPVGKMSRVTCAHRSPVGKMSRVTCAHRSPVGKMSRVICAHRSPVGKCHRSPVPHRSP